MLYKSVKITPYGTWQHIMAQQKKVTDVRKIVNEGLELTRQNLLDLSGRNRLINFKHSGAKILRFVDEVPNQIYAELVEAADSQKKGFLISPVPLPKKSEYPDLFESKDLKKLDVKAHAQKLGINTEWELAAVATSDQARHQDDKLQTLHFPEELDRMVRRIQSEARTAIEESGVNMLFLCLGFLKWNDRDDSEVFYHAPLIMVPIEIERDKVDARTGFAKFRLMYSGEDILDNICLREKLRQMAIELPSFDEFDSPESYFSALSAQLADIKPDWQIQRFATVGFLSFGKMLMYLDLNPANWPGEDGIAEAPHILDIFAGNHSGDSSIASEFDIDEDRNIQHIAQIMDADSSQHSAIIDVMNGRNLVIEGPPGTGKSQTITNLIAACLEQGKTVLFVAEKLAALEVVKRRLDSVNLGDFCLELHSHKSQKKAVLSDLKKRLEYNTNSNRAAAGAAEEQLQELNQKKAKLIQYAKAINTPFGKIEQTPHEIFWKTEVLQKALGQPYKPENFSPVKNVMELVPAAIRSHMEAIRNLADNLRNYFDSEHHKKNHYWNGLGLAGTIDYAKQQDIFQSLQTLGIAAKRAVVSLEQLQTYGYANFVFKNFPTLQSRLSQLQADDFQHAHLFAKLDLTSAHTVINEALGILSAYQESLEKYWTQLAGLGLTPDTIAALDIKSIQETSLPANMPVAELKTISGTLEGAISAFLKVQPLFKEAAGYVGLNDDLNSIEGLKAILATAEYCSALDKRELALRNPTIETTLGNELITKLPVEVAALRERRADLDNLFNLQALPTQERLTVIAAALHNKKLLSPLSSEWRGARADYCKAAKNDACKDANTAAAKIDKLLHYLRDVESFGHNAALCALLPGIFKGIDTDMDGLRTAVSYYEKLRAQFLAMPVFGTRLYHVLRGMEPHLYEWFSQNYKALVGGIDGVEAASTIITSLDGKTAENGVTGSIAYSSTLKAECLSLESILRTANVSDKLSLNDIRNAMQAAQNAAISKDKFLSNLTIQTFDFVADREALSEQASVLTSLVGAINKVHETVPPSMLGRILCHDGFVNTKACIELIAHICEYQNALQSVHTVLQHSKDLGDFWAYTEGKDKGLLEAVARKLAVIDDESETFDRWCEVLNGFAEMKHTGLDAIVVGFTNSTDLQVPFAEYPALYQYLVYHSLSQEVLRQNRVLGSFSRVTHENLRLSFKEIDLELQKLNAKKLARTISHRVIPEGSGGRSPKEFTDAHLIRHEIGKQKAHIPIRQLVNRAYGALIAMKPCFMMGPLSVAQYIPASHEKFDILIMDEASQVKPEDAIGVLARAKQVVVVGDSNQLPPTGFFDTLGGDGDGDDGTTIENSESILDVCKPLFQPLRRLRWHYRSRHQSLISFSNNHFYDNDLVIFPSPTTHSETTGVKHVYVQDGIYTSQSNPIEAARVVAELIEMVRAHPDLSYGIVTLNSKQKMIIEDEIERARKDNPVFDNYVSESELTSEKLFVKNLENVQGDERDVIFISTTFGLDENGGFRQNFGPINGKDGWRRLNVLFTRAKHHVRIFSSFTPERIKVDDTKEQRGLRALKDYLHFAMTGVDNHSYLTELEPDSDFERAVGGFLKDQGYDVVYQLGVAGYRIDMVVKHPQCPTDYFIAIECDGATYHSARSARDRDRLREDNLRKLGWNHIHRIWSADWFKRRGQEEARLLQAVEMALNDRAIAA